MSAFLDSVSDAEDRVELCFSPEDAIDAVEDKIAVDLSGLALADDVLFTACDETAGVERLSYKGDGDYAAHKHFCLSEFFSLPDGASGEMDIEGLAVEDHWLWVCGSHSLKRDQAHRDDTNAASRSLAATDRDANRGILARIPLERDADGWLAPVAEDSQNRIASCVPLKRGEPALKSWLKRDPLIEPSLTLPCKENGFDIEGLAVRGDRVYLGLRGPVVQSHAVILELVMKVTKTGALKPRKLEHGMRFRRHLLPLEGLGIRDLRFDGNAMLILTGPTLASEGPSKVWKWESALAAVRSGEVAETEIEAVLSPPFRGANDYPEGLEIFTASCGSRKAMVVYDSPAPDRVSCDCLSVDADIFDLGPPR